MHLSVRSICSNAIVAALYVVLTVLTSSFSYMGIQFRIAEMLILLCFFRKDYAIGVTLGCFVANFLGPMGYIDAIFGTIATIISTLGIMFSKWLLPTLLAPVIVNGLVVGAELYFIYEIPFWINAGYVMLGELVVVVAAYIIIMVLKRRKFFYKVIDAKQNLEFKF